PSGIVCHAPSQPQDSCSANFASGTIVTLTASAASGSNFAGWSGACSGTATCQVTMNQAKSVLATYNSTAALSVSRIGQGSVTSSPSGISCPNKCTANYAIGTKVTLTATPADGSRFTGWGMACSGTSTCTVTMQSDQNVTATFTTRRRQ